MRLNSGNACYLSVQKLFLLLCCLETFIILPVVPYGYETWSLTVKVEHRLTVFEKRALRRIFGPKRDEVTGGWRKLHNEELHNVYSTPSIIKMIKSRAMRSAGHVAQMRSGMYTGYWREIQKEKETNRKTQTYVKG
jgi:hypothetical protein